MTLLYGIYNYLISISVYMNGQQLSILVLFSVGSICSIIMETWADIVFDLQAK